MHPIKASLLSQIMFQNISLSLASDVPGWLLRSWGEGLWGARVTGLQVLPHRADLKQDKWMYVKKIIGPTCQNV